VIGRDIPELDALLTDTGTWQFGDLNFTIYEGQGGHLAGEMVLVERERRLVFPGDIFINLKELSPQQAECNSFAPYLMASVDTDPTLSAAERRALPQILGSGQWTYFTGHGLGELDCYGDSYEVRLEELVDSLEETDRGDNGFGSTGR